MCDTFEMIVYYLTYRVSTACGVEYYEECEWRVVKNVDDIEHDLSTALWLESDDNHEIPSCFGCCADIRTQENRLYTSRLPSTSHLYIEVKERRRFGPFPYLAYVTTLPSACVSISFTQMLVLINTR